MFHEDDRGRKEVISDLIKEVQENKEADKILDYLPESRNRPVSPVQTKLNIAKLLPVSLKSFQYYGSITQLLCTKGVLCNILNNPIKISKGQIK